MFDKRPLHGLAVLVLVAVATPVMETRSGTATREIPVEILRYDAVPAAIAPATDTAAAGLSGVLGPPQLGAYLVRFRLLPGERIVVAKGLIRDGFAPRSRLQGTGRVAARLVGSLGYHLVLRKVPGDLHETIGPLAGLILPGSPDWIDRGPRPERVLVLRDDVLHYHDGYAAALVMIQANALTRIDFHRIVTRLEGRGRERTRAATVLVQAGREIDREDMLLLMAGPSSETFQWHGAGARSGNTFAEPLLPGPVARPHLAGRTRARDGFGPP